MAYQEKCTKCGEYWWTDKAHFCRAKETRSGSPLESVVQGRSESPAPLNPDRSRDAILGDLSNVYCRLRKWQMSMPSTGDVLMRQQVGRICSELDALFDLSEQKRQHSTQHEAG